MKTELLSPAGGFEALRAAEESDVIYMPLGLFEKIGGGDKFAVELPKVTYDIERYIERMKKAGVKRALASTVGAAYALIGAGIECIGDFGLNVTNGVSAEEYRKMGIGTLTLSPELTGAGIKEVTGSTAARCEIIVYGRMTMMTTRACLIRGVRGRCDCERQMKLKDRTGAEFLVYADREEHINTVYNAVPTFMADRMDEIRGLGADGVRLVFTSESTDEVRKIIAMYLSRAEAELPKSYTRGYFSKSKKQSYERMRK